MSDARNRIKTNEFKTMPKVDEIDFNGNSVADATGQVEKTEPKEKEVESSTEDETSKNEPLKTEEDVETLPQWAKDRLTKVEVEKENYKKGMLKYKRTLEPEKVEEKTEVEYPEWDETSKKFQEQTEKKAASIAERKAQETVEKYNEKAAISSFISKHPELDNNDNWTDLISNYHSKNGKESVQAIEKDLDRAYFVYRYERGEISNLEAEAFKKGEQKGKTQAKVEDMSSVGTTTQKTVNDDGKSISEGALKLAQAMRVDPNKLADEDDSSTAEIKL